MAGISSNSYIVERTKIHPEQTLGKGGVWIATLSAQFVDGKVKFRKRMDKKL